MSYVEHGARIFLTGGSKKSFPLVYGDYVLPRKRSEGRLKVYDSCSDIRAWSPNILESSRYFRELNEYGSMPGKIVPYEVVIENILDLTSRAQNELHLVRKELKRYKSLKLTPQQAEELQRFDGASTGDYRRTDRLKIDRIGRLLSKDADVNKVPSVVRSDSCLSIKNFLRDQTYCLLSPRTSSDLEIPRRIHNYIEKGHPILRTQLSESFEDEDEGRVPSRVEYADASVQVDAPRAACEIAVQTSPPLREFTTSTATIASVKEDTLSSSDEVLKLPADNLAKEFDLASTCSEESRASCSSSSDVGIRGSGHKTVIIEKDSEIIALKNELAAKEAELDELREVNKTFESLLREKDENLNVLRASLKGGQRCSLIIPVRAGNSLLFTQIYAAVILLAISHDKLVGMGDQRSYELEDLRKKLSASKYIVDKLKEELDHKYQTCCAQAQEIEKLRSFANEVLSLRADNESLIKRVKGMERQAKEAESCSLALEQLKDALRERDQLQKRNREQSCILADQEDEIKQLLTLINQMSSTHNERQARMKEILEESRAEIREKNRKISQCEEQLRCMEREVSELTEKLKSSLNNLEKFRGDARNCPECDHDVATEMQHALCNLNTLMAELQEYKTERRELLLQIRNLKRYIREDKRMPLFCRSSTFSSVSDQNLSRISTIDNEITVKDADSHISDAEKGTNMSINDDKIVDTGSEVPSNATNSDVIDLENCSDKETENSDNRDLEKNSAECVIKELKTQISILRRKGSIDEMEKEIIEKASRSLIKMQTLMREMQRYVENERPFMIKQIQDLRQALKGSTVTYSQDIISQKQRICELYNQRREQYEKYKSHVKELPEELNDMQVSQSTDSTDSVIYQQLEEILQLEEIFAYDEQVDRALAVHIKCSIEKIHEISAALQGAGDQRAEIEKEIARRQHEIREKDAEIARLRDEMREKGEGDRAMNKTVRDLEDRLRSLESKLSICYEECDKLKIRNKDLLDIKNSLLRDRDAKDSELISKSKRIDELWQKLSDSTKTVHIVRDLEMKIEEMNKKLIFLQSENSDLRAQLLEAHESILKKDENMSDMREKEDSMKDAFARKVAECSIEVERRDDEIVRLRDENVLLSKKLKDAENRLLETERTISSLNKEEDKINMIYALQEDVGKLGKEKKRLEAEIGNLGAEFLRYKNCNKKLADKLDSFLRKNADLARDIERLKNENTQLSLQLVDRSMLKDDLRSKLSSLPQRIFEKIMMLRKGTDFRSDDGSKSASDQSKKLSDDEGEEVSCIKETNEDLRSTLQTNEVENLGLKDKPIEEGSEFSGESKDKEKVWDNSSTHKLIELEKLMQDVENRDSEIESLKIRVSSLLQENDELRKKVENQAQKYQDTLVALKKKYDSGVSAMRKEHCDSIQRLQARCEEIMAYNQIPFDSETWLKSLTAKELAELHNRICTLTSCSIADYDTNAPQKPQQNEGKYALYRNTSKFEEELCERQTDLYREAGKAAFDVEAEPEGTNKLLGATSAQERRKSEFYSHEMFAALNQKQRADGKNRYRNQKSHYSANDTTLAQAELSSQKNVVTVERDQRCPYISADNVSRNIPVNIASLTPNQETPRRDTFDWQRKNFIHQCSVRALNR